MLKKTKAVMRFMAKCPSLHLFENKSLVSSAFNAREEMGNQKNEGRTYDVDENKGRFFRASIDPTMLLISKEL
jgi:hypothetical protein